MSKREAIMILALVVGAEIGIVYLHAREVREQRMLFDQCVMTLNQVRP